MTTAEIYPNNDASPNDWSLYSGTPHYDEINNPPGSPSDVDYIAATYDGGDDGDLENFDFTTFDNIQDNSITQVTVYTYGVVINNQPEIAVSWDGGDNFTSYVEVNLPTGASNWTSNTWSGLSYSKSDLDQFQVSYQADTAIEKQANTIGTVYVVVTYTTTSAGYGHDFIGVLAANIDNVCGVPTANIDKIKGV